MIHDNIEQSQKRLLEATVNITNHDLIYYTTIRSVCRLFQFFVKIMIHFLTQRDYGFRVSMYYRKFQWQFFFS